MFFHQFLKGEQFLLFVSLDHKTNTKVPALKTLNTRDENG